LKVAVRVLFFAIPNVTSIACIMVLSYFVFAVVAVSHFKGRLHYCSGSLIELERTVRDKWDCLDAGGGWRNRVYNWDSIPEACVQLLIMSTTEGYGEMLVNTIMSVGED
jgi:hypothetical protein